MVDDGRRDEAQVRRSEQIYVVVDLDIGVSFCATPTGRYLTKPTKGRCKVRCIPRANGFASMHAGVCLYRCVADCGLKRI